MTATGDKSHAVILTIWPGLSDTMRLPSLPQSFDKTIVDEETQERILLTFTLRGKVGRLPRYVCERLMREKEAK